MSPQTPTRLPQLLVSWSLARIAPRRNYQLRRSLFSWLDSAIHGWVLDFEHRGRQMLHPAAICADPVLGEAVNGHTGLHAIGA